MAFIQTVVRYKDESGVKRRVVVKHASPNVTVGNLKGITDVVCFESQNDGTIHIIQKSLVIEVFKEEEDPKYGTFHRIETINI